jgi:hypothetical protein
LKEKKVQRSFPVITKSRVVTQVGLFSPNPSIDLGCLIMELRKREPKTVDMSRSHAAATPMVAEPEDDELSPEPNKKARPMHTLRLQ